MKKTLVWFVVVFALVIAAQSVLGNGSGIGIYFNDSDDNVLVNATALNNSRDGIYLTSTSTGNDFTDTRACYNNQSGGAYYDLNDQSVNANTWASSTYDTDNPDNDTYFAHSYWCNGSAFGPPPPLLPTITTLPATNITATSAILHSNFTRGNYTPVNVSFQYRRNGTLNWTNTTPFSYNASGTRAQSVSGLSPNTTYNFRAKLDYNPTIFGNISNFTTLAGPTATVTALAPVTPSSDNTPVITYTLANGPTSVELYRATVATGPYTLIGTDATVDGTYQVPAVIPDGTYYFAARGIGANGEALPTASEFGPYVIDTSGPTVLSVTSPLANGRYTVGQAVPVTVTFSEAVTYVAGTGVAQLQLETGTPDRQVPYSSGSGTAVLRFTYTVQAGDTSTDLEYLSVNALTLTGTATIRNAATKNAVLTLPALGSAQSLGGSKAIVIDTSGPTITTIVPADGAAGVATNAQVVVTWSEAMNPAVGTVNIVPAPTVPGTWAWSGGSTIYTYSGAKWNSPSVLYTLTFNSFTDVVGNAAAGDLVKVFTTVALPPTSATATTIVESSPTTDTTPQITYTHTGSPASVQFYYTSNGGTTWTAWDTDAAPTGPPDTFQTTTALPGAGTYHFMAKSPSEAVPSGAGSIEVGPYVIDLTAPNITITNPSNGAINVPVTQNIVITFSEAIKTSTFVVGTTFTCSPNPGGWGVPAWSGGNTIVTLTHTNFAGGTFHTCTVAVGVTDAAGNPLAPGAAPNPWTFTTFGVPPYTGCVDLLNSSTYQGKVIGVPHVNLTIVNDTTLCNKTYNINASSPAIAIGCSNCILDCNGSIINGTNTGTGIDNNGSDYVTVKNCAVQNYDSGIYYYTNANYGVIENNIVNSNDNFGIFLYESSNNTLENNTANSNNWHGIFLDSSSNNNTITNNTANSNIVDGIFLRSSSYNTLTDNNPSNNTRGIRLELSSNNTLTNNNVSNNKYGIGLDSSLNNSITNNTANSNTYDGILFDSSSNNTLTNNTASNNSRDGISLTSDSIGNDFTNTHTCFNPNYDLNDQSANANFWISSTYDTDNPDNATYFDQIATCAAPLIPPTITTLPATSVTTSSATLNSNFTTGNYTPVNVSFEYRRNGTTTWTNTTNVSYGADGIHAQPISGLSSGTTYEFRAKLEYNPTIFGAILTFTTPTPSAPTPEPSHPKKACEDNQDNDLDGLTDYPDDPGCTDSSDDSELNIVQCDDGLDNDGDGKTDYPSDPGCDNAVDNDERDVVVCEENWICSRWEPEACPVTGIQTRICEDWNKCGTEVLKPLTAKSCMYVPAETCDDGIQNQGEEGVDCGGPCLSCPACFTPKNYQVYDLVEDTIICSGDYYDVSFNVIKEGISVSGQGIVRFFDGRTLFNLRTFGDITLSNFEIHNYDIGIQLYNAEGVKIQGVKIYGETILPEATITRDIVGAAYNTFLTAVPTNIFPPVINFIVDMFNPDTWMVGKAYTPPPQIRGRARYVDYTQEEEAPLRKLFIDITGLNGDVTGKAISIIAPGIEGPELTTSVTENIGIYAVSSDNIVIKNSVLSTLSQAIYLEDTEGFVIQYSDILDSPTTIFTKGVSAVDARYNYWGGDCPYIRRTIDVSDRPNEIVAFVPLFWPRGNLIGCDCIYLSEALDGAYADIGYPLMQFGDSKIFKVLEIRQDTHFCSENYKVPDDAPDHPDVALAAVTKSGVKVWSDELTVDLNDHEMGAFFIWSSPSAPEAAFTDITFGPGISIINTGPERTGTGIASKEKLSITIEGVHFENLDKPVYLRDVTAIDLRDSTFNRNNIGVTIETLFPHYTIKNNFFDSAVNFDIPEIGASLLDVKLNAWGVGCGEIEETIDVPAGVIKEIYPYLDPKTGEEMSVCTITPCVDLDDDTTWPSIGFSKTGNTFYIDTNVKLCAGDYSLYNFKINDFSSLDCDGSAFAGDSSAAAIIIDTGTRHASVENCRFSDYLSGLNLADVRDSEFTNLQFERMKSDAVVLDGSYDNVLEDITVEYSQGSGIYVTGGSSEGTNEFIRTTSCYNFFDDIYVDPYSVAEFYGGNYPVCDDAVGTICLKACEAPPCLYLEIDEIPYYINEDVVLCPNYYRLCTPRPPPLPEPEGGHMIPVGFIMINSSNITIDCNGSTLSCLDYAGEGIQTAVQINPGYYGITIKNCHIEGFDKAVESYLSNNIKILSNTFTQNGQALTLSKSYYLQIIENTFESNNQAYAIDNLGSKGIRIK